MTYRIVISLGSFTGFKKDMYVHSNGKYICVTNFNALRSEMYVCINIWLPAPKFSSSFNSNSGNKYSQRGSQTLVVTYTFIMSYGILLKLNLIKALSWVTYSTDYRINCIFLCKAGILMNQSEPEGNVSSYIQGVPGGM